MRDLQRYLDRIGYHGTLKPRRETLFELHRRHLLSIPYENFDVQLGRRVGLDIGPIYEKLVVGRRGGWCYEMNGLFGWALDEIGFSVTRIAAGVGRAASGETAVGNHLALRVDFEEPYVADVGFGDGFFEPAPIRSGPIEQRGFHFSLEQLPDGWWRVHNHADSSAPSFDFSPQPCDWTVLERQCTYLQTSPESSFTQVAVAQRHVPAGVVLLRGRVLRRVEGRKRAERVIEDLSDYKRTLREVFDLEPPELDMIWARAEEQHRAFLRSRARPDPDDTPLEGARSMSAP